MNYMVKALAASAGLGNIHSHRERHTFASRLIEDGMDAYLAMQLTRYQSVQAQSLEELLEERR